uniref:Ion transport domain-containing protein n=1 Tax=Dendroctonus ponderosae TaxID=77166 RepID=A0AAR5P9W3_DENPD
MTARTNETSTLQPDSATENIPLLEIVDENQNPTIVIPAAAADQSLEERLQSAVIGRNRAEVEDILDPNNTSEADLRTQLSHKFETENGTRKILSIACEKSSIEILRLVYEKVIEFESEPRDESWYYWGPLHFAAYCTDCKKLDAIIGIIQDRNKLNSLSIFSENALHVLLEYGRRIESFPVQLTNGWESRICHIIPEEHDEIVECARLLIDAGIDVNHNNIWNETPLIIAIRYRLLRVIQLLLMKKDIDLDSCKDMRSRKSARDLLRENEIHLNMLSPHTVTVPPVQTLFTFLKSDDEELFLRYNNENIKQFVNEVDGYEGFTMLQLCLIKGYIEYEKRNVKSKRSQDRDILKTDMLKFFCEKGYGRSVEHVLNNSADVKQKTKLFGNRNVFQMAAKLSYYPFLTVLLQHRLSQVSEADILEVLANVNEDFFQSNNYNARHVLFLLGNKLEILKIAAYDYHNRLSKAPTISEFDSEAQGNQVNERFQNRQILNKILNLYLMNNSHNDEFKDYICQILRLGASLTGAIPSEDNALQKTQSSTGFERLAECFKAVLKFGSSRTQDPNQRINKLSYETLSSHLDQCIDSKGNVCYDSLIMDDRNNDRAEYSETVVLHYLVHNPKKSDLLNHPVLIYLIHSKWLMTRRFFHVNLIFYSTFLLFLYLHTVMLQMKMSSIAISVIFTILLLVQVFKECLQLILYFPRYFIDPSNYLEISTIVCSFINLFATCEIAMILAVLFSTVIFLLMLGQLPKFTKYMIIFSSTKYFLEYAAFYFIQFVSFAVCFLILLPSEEKLESSWTNALGEVLIKLFDTLVYFIGQYDGDISSPPKFPVFGRIIVALFIFCMSIILNNLLVGLIVTDMDMIQKTSKQQRQVKMIKFIVRIETFLKSISDKAGILNRFCKTRVFDAGDRKVININHLDLKSIFDEDDTMYLKKIQENLLDHSNVLNSLYEYIISGIYNDRRNAVESRDILFKLARLEEKLRKRR